MKRFDVAVVGCGAMGASLSYNLASRGLKVLALDRFRPGHRFGSSHGKTRIIRTAYSEDPRYVPLVRRAFQSWRELESKSGRRLLVMTGGLMVGGRDSGIVTGALKSAREHGLRHEVLSARETRERFGVFSLDEDQVAVHEEDAGVLLPEDCVEAFTSIASGLGVEFLYETPVISWVSEREGIRLETKSDSYTADKMALASGAWMGPLLGGLLPLACERQVPFWFSSAGDGRFVAPSLPIFVFEEGDGRLFYGIPDLGHGVKVAQHHGGPKVDPDQVQTEVDERDLAPVAGFIGRRLPGLPRSPIESMTCLYTNTPDGNFAVGLHPEEKRVLIMSACSGHGFKFSSVMGEVGAEILDEGKTRFDISFLDPGRFLT